MTNKYNKFVATAATATLVASAIVPVASANEVAFTDIGGYAQDTQDKINSLVERGIVNGTSETTFNPTAPIKRSQVVKLLGRYLVEELGADIPADWNTEARFTDVELTKDEELSKYAAVVFDAGVFAGNNGALEGSKEISRQNMAIVLNRAAEAITGVTFVEAAEGLEHNVTDLAVAKDEAQQAIAALNALEISTATAFNPTNNVSRANFATFLYNAIDVIAELTEGEVVAPTVDEEIAAVEEAVTALPKEVTVETVATAKAAKAAVNEAIEALEAAVEEAGEELDEEQVTAAKEAIVAATAAVAKVEEAIAAAEEVAAELAVTSVTSLNATQAKVTFSKKVEKDSAQDAANYTFTTLDGVAATVDTVVLAEDGKSAVVTFKAPASKRYQVKITGVEAADNDKETVSYDEIVTFAADTTAPTVVGTERISSNKVKVAFSEPVNGSTSAITAKYADGTAITGLGSLAVSASNELIVDMTDTNVTVDKDIVITFNGVTDTNGNLLTPQPATVTVKKVQADGVKPELTAVNQTGAKEFTIDFNKDLVNFEAATGNVTVTGNTVTKIEKVTASQYKVTVSTALNGLQTVAVVAEKAVDIDGQKNTAALAKLVTFAADTVAPKATGKLVVGEDNKEYVELTFDKAVTAGSVTITGSYVKDYVTTTISTPVTATAKYADDENKKVVLVPLTGLAVEGATYTVKVNSTTVKSDADQAMAETEVTFTRGKDGEAVVSNTNVVTGVAVAQGSTPDEVKVTFTMPKGAKLEGATATALANYTIAGATVQSVSLAGAVEGTDASTQVATLTLQEGSNTFTGVRNITVKDVKVSGSTKVMDAKTINTVSLTENVRPTVEGAKITADNAITVTFSEAMTVVDATPFVVKAGSEALALDLTKAPTILDATKPEVTIYLKDAFTVEQLAQTITIAPIALTNGEVDTENFKITDKAGNLLEAFAPVTVVKP